MAFQVIQNGSARFPDEQHGAAAHPTVHPVRGRARVRRSSRTSGSGRAAGTGHPKTRGSPRTVTGEQQQRCGNARPGSPHSSRGAPRCRGGARCVASVGNRGRVRHRIFRLAPRACRGGGGQKHRPEPTASTSRQHRTAFTIPMPTLRFAIVHGRATASPPTTNEPSSQLQPHAALLTRPRPPVWSSPSSASRPDGRTPSRLHTGFALPTFALLVPHPREADPPYRVPHNPAHPRDGLQ